MGIRMELEELLKKAGVPPARMNSKQFFEEFAKRMNQSLPGVLQWTANRVAGEIYEEELAKIGRSSPCRYLNEKPEKHCNKPPDCYTCLSYKPVPRWRHRLNSLKNRKYLDIGIVAGATLSFIAIMLVPQIEIKIYTLIIWFVLVIASRVEVYLVYKLLEVIKGQNRPPKE